MAELQFSAMLGSSGYTEALLAALREFEAQHRIAVRLRLIPWDIGWGELIKIALYRDGPDVSQVGSTWISELARLHALRPYREDEITALGGPATFIPASWQAATLAGPQVWAIPWMADTRILYYRWDLLKAAGINEWKAFETQEQLERTLTRLQESRIEIPWVVPTAPSTRRTLHDVASWIWTAGGDLVSPDGKHALFNEPAARVGIRRYFELGRYLVESARRLSATEADALFYSGQAAVTLSGPWLLHQRDAIPKTVANTNMTFPPVIPFVGGSHLVIWQHSRQPEAAVNLVHFLSGRHVQSSCSRHAGHIPTRFDALTIPPFSTDPFYRHLVPGLKTGRAFPSFYLWGLVEEKLTEALGQLWADFFADPQLDLDQAILRRLEPVAEHLDRVMGGY